MRIKKLELVGFKSFKDRTVIQFDAGITGIVGPNGCGKSNIVDALVWVMGEMSAKHLRGSNMSDVIFAGAENYAPMGMAEVSLTLENDGGPFPAKYMKHSEVMITRKLHRSGESEYFVNREPARLKDIQEIFMDTGAGSKGFSIVEQGAIGRIVTSKPEERRTLIEEAAGITKFKARKRESQRKLVSTEQNLVRLQDIIGEQKRQLGSLERQAQRAERYRKLKIEAEEKEITLLANKYLASKAELDEADKLYANLREAEVGQTSDMEQWETDLEDLKTTRAELENLVQEAQSVSYESTNQVSLLENQLRDLNFEVEQAKRDKEMTGTVIQQYQAREKALSDEKLRLETALNEKREVFEATEADFLEKQEAFQSGEQRIQSLDDELTQARKQSILLTQSETHLQAKCESLDEKIMVEQDRLSAEQEKKLEVQETHQNFQARYNDLYKKFESEKQMQLDIMKDVESFHENFEHLKVKTEERRSEVETLKDDLNEVSSRLYGLENLRDNFEGFQEGVKSVMLWQRERQEQLGAEGAVSFQPVAEVVEVPQEYELAMESALGTKLQMLLSDQGDQAVEAIDYLKDKNSGRSSFVAKDWAGSADSSQDASLSSEEGVVAQLSDVVRVPDSYRDQIVLFLKDVIIVDSIRTALRLRPSYPGRSFVTREGDLLSADGVLTGGSSESADSGVLKRQREIKELSVRREECAGKLALAQASFKKLQAQMEQVGQELELAQKRQSEKEIEVVALKKDYERAEQELAQAKRALENQEELVSRLTVAAEDLYQSRQEMAEQLLEAQTDKAETEARVEALTAEYNELRESFSGLSETVTQLRVKTAEQRSEVQSLENSLRNVETNLNEVSQNLGQMTEARDKSDESLSSNSVLIETRQIELERAIEEADEAKLKLSQVKDQFEQVSAQIRELETKVSSQLRLLNEHKAKLGDSHLKLEQLRMKEEHLVEQAAEKYMKDLREVAESYRDDNLDVKALNAEVEEIKGKLGRIGEVNLSAIEEYDELKERYDFLSQQYEDLMASKEQLRKVIDRINRICSKRFKETYEQVNERFQRVFPVLFGGGEARLILIEDPDKPGDAGIDIVSRPPGKKLQNVSLLSGGEKALTAVSLIFSIFLVKPSPFCLLDEVDAPLDDANVMRFNDLVKEMAKRSQIIVVTHNKHTMKVNDKMFGVTMQEKGVSKMVSVSLEQAQAVAGR